MEDPILTILAHASEVMRDYGLHKNNVTFIGLPEEGFDCTWDEFAEMANSRKTCMSDLEIHFSVGCKLIYFDGEWNYQSPIIKEGETGNRKLTTLDINELSIQKAELLELQRLKTKYES